MRSICRLVPFLLLPALSASAQRIEVTLPNTQPVTGHLVLVFAKSSRPEPRFQLEENYLSAQGFGVDVEAWPAGKPIVVDAKTFGYPRRSLKDLDAGDYFVQAVFNVYEQFHLASGKTVWLPPDKGEGQHWNRKPGNPYNKPEKIHFDPATSGDAIKLALDQVIPPIEGTDRDPEVMAEKTARRKMAQVHALQERRAEPSSGASDVYLGAWILLPDGFDEHPDAHYPLIVYQDHFNPGFRPAEFHRAPRPIPNRRIYRARSERLPASSRTGHRAGCRA